MPHLRLDFAGRQTYCLCLKIDANGDWSEVYYGDFQLVELVSRRSERDNKSMIAITALTKIREAGYKISGNYR